MQKHSVTWDGKTINFETNNTGIVSQNCFQPFEAAGITRAKLLEFEHHSFSKGIVVKIGGKSVRFSHDFEDPSDKATSATAAASTGLWDLDKTQLALDAVKDHPDLLKTFEELYADEIAAIKEREEAKKREKDDMVLKLKELGVTLTDKQLKELGVAC